MLRQSSQRQSISCAYLTAFRYCCREIPLLHILCCHRSQPSHCSPSCLARTGSLQRMHKSWWAIVIEKESSKRVLLCQQQREANDHIGCFSRFLYVLCSIQYSASTKAKNRQSTRCVGWSDDSCYMNALAQNNNNDQYQWISIYELIFLWKCALKISWVYIKALWEKITCLASLFQFSNGSDQSTPTC